MKPLPEMDIEEIARHAIAEDFKKDGHGPIIWKYFSQRTGIKIETVGDCRMVAEALEVDSIWGNFSETGKGAS